MLVIGLLLIIAALVVGFGAIYDGGESASFELLGQTLDTTIAGVFVAGAVAMLLLLLGIAAVMSSMGRARRKRAERKEARKRQKASVQELEEERAALRAENERLAEKLHETERAPAGTTTGTTGTATAAGTAGAAGGATAAGADAPEPHEHHGGARGLMDKVTGRVDHDHPPDMPDTGAPRAYESASPTQTGNVGDNDRVIDHTTDLTTHEQTQTSGHNRDQV